jgi:hypothetical protein
LLCFQANADGCSFDGHRFRITLALLSARALSPAAHAATFDFTATGAGGGFGGSGTFVATPDGGGEYTITGISGTFVDGLVAPGGFNGNDNLLFPSASTLVDTHGFAFTATQTDTDFTVDIFSSGPGTYDAYFLDNDGFSATIPVTFQLRSSPSPRVGCCWVRESLDADCSRRRGCALSPAVGDWSNTWDSV